MAAKDSKAKGAKAGATKAEGAKAAAKGKGAKGGGAKAKGAKVGAKAQGATAGAAKTAGRGAEIGLHTLRPKPGSKRPRRRVGRGEGSGLGKTAGRGTKGYGARSGAKRKAAYEGGQNPIHMRMRKLRGPRMKKSMPFERFRTSTQPVNVGDLEARFEAGSEVTPQALREKGLAKGSQPVKILASGEVSKRLEVHAHGFSAAARAKIESAGGTCNTLGP